MSDKKAIILNFSKESDQSGLLRTLEEEFKDNEDVDVLTMRSGSDAGMAVANYTGAVVLFSIYDRVDVTEIIQLTTIIKKNIKNGTVKLAGFNNLNNAKVTTYLNKNGCAEQFSKSLAQKALRYKINLWFKAIDFSYKKVLQQEKQKEALKAKEVRFVEPLDLESDCWILKSKEDIRNALKQWFIELAGPSPFTGTWDKIENKRDPDGQYWEWKPKAEDDFPFIVDRGFWIAKGQHPIFSWETNLWTFSGSDAYLAFYEEDNKGQLAYRFVASIEKGADVAENSDAAKFKMELIEESCHPKYNAAHEEENEDEGECSFDDELNSKLNDDEINQEEKGLSGHLKGSQSKEKQIDGKLRGKLAGQNEVELDTDDKERGSNFGEDGQGDSSGLGASSLDIEFDRPEQESNNPFGSEEDPNRAKASSSKLDIEFDKDKKQNKKDEFGEDSERSNSSGSSSDIEFDKSSKQRNSQHGEEDDRGGLDPSEDMELALEKARKELSKGHGEDSPIDNQDAAKSNLDLDFSAAGASQTKTKENEGKGPNSGKGNTDKLADKKQNGEGSTDKLANNLNGKSSFQEADDKDEAFDSDRSPNANSNGKNQGAGAQNGADIETSSKRDGEEGNKSNKSNFSEKGKGGLNGSGSTDKLDKPDIEGDGHKADYIEKYYGTKRRKTDDEVNKRDKKSRSAGPQNKPKYGEAEDFKGIATEVDLFNGDSINLTDIKLQLELVRKSSKTGLFDLNTEVELSDLYEDCLVLNSDLIPNIQDQEKVIVKFETSYVGQNRYGEFVGNIEEVEGLDDNHVALAIRMSKFKTEDVRDLHDMFMKRQGNIVNFLHAANGTSFND